MAPEEQIRGFKGVWIPSAVWLDKRLNALEKIILVEIDSLDNGEKGCFASNQYLADFCQCSERKIRDAIAKLKEYGYLYVSGFDGRVRTLRTRMAELSTEGGKNCQADGQEMPHINKENNKDIIIKERKKEAETYDSIIDANMPGLPLEIRSTIYEFIKMRKLIKKPLTNKGLELMLKKLKELSHDKPAIMIDILNQSIMNNWQGIFPLKEERTFGSNQQKRSRVCDNTEEIELPF